MNDIKYPFLIGSRIYLRPLIMEDVDEEYVGWLNDSQVTRYLETGKFPSTLKTVRQYVERFQDSTTNFAFAITLSKGGEHIGNVTLNNLNWIHRIADTGLMIGRKGLWNRGYAFEAWSLVLKYAFQRLGLRKIIAYAIWENIASITVLRKLGFKVEGLHRKELFIEGKYRDGVRFGLFREEFYKYAGEENPTKIEKVGE